MRTLIIDDERLARAELRRLLAAHPHIEIVGEAANAAEAHQLVRQLQPDLLLLDIQMPDGTGFDLLAALESVPRVIFTTAYDSYALRAFEVSALDYLMKPISATRLAAALGKATAHATGQTTSQTVGQASAQSGEEKLFIKDGERCWFVELSQISLFESEGNYTRVYFSQQQPLMLRSLSQLEQKLDPARFLRTSRRHIVNLAHVDTMAAGEGGILRLSLKDGRQVDMSRRRAAEYKNQATV
jgi:two-component system LytT family response regulator